MVKSRMIALVVAGQPGSHRQSRYVNLALAFGAALAYKWISNVIYSANRVEDSTLFLMVVIPVAAIIVSIWMYGRGIEVAVPERLVMVFQSAWQRLGALRLPWQRYRSA